MTPAGERNRRFSERRGAQGVEKRNKRAIQQAARRAYRRREKETRDSARGAAGKESKRDRNKRFSKRCGGRVIGGCHGKASAPGKVTVFCCMREV
jgi:hypothetical protein